MEWIEVIPLPDECVNCEEEECYNCDVAGMRWVLSQKDADIIRRKMQQRSMTGNIPMRKRHASDD